ncbi:MAG: XisI protein, partial [Leptolyngbyaceae cyanobacterium SM1_4_3]|nr:XisI protein [Leptolyngbyaceae cyanobacterium SM1_4_3]
MDTLESYRQIIENILNEYTQIPYAYGDIQTEAVFDRKSDRYVLMNVGWDDGKRVHGSLVHIDIIDGKL